MNNSPAKTNKAGIWSRLEALLGHERPRWARHLQILVLAFLLVFFGSENYLYLRHWELPNNRGLEANHIDDAQCGWLPMPGQSYSREDQRALTTVWPNHQRASRPNVSERKAQRLLLLGCSYTFGMGVSDNQTYAWKLGQQLPNTSVENGGVIGFSTYQCLLRLRQLYEQGEHYDRVIYAAIQDHQIRNVKMRVFGKNAEHSDFVGTPYVTYQPQGLVTHGLRHLSLPGETRFRIINFLSMLRVNSLTRQTKARQAGDLTHRREVFNMLVGQLADLVKQHQGEFLLVLLDGTNDYSLSKLGGQIVYLDVSYPGIDLPVNRVGGIRGRHPNAKVHHYWADKLAKQLK